MKHSDPVEYPILNPPVSFMNYLKIQLPLFLVKYLQWKIRYYSICNICCGSNACNISNWIAACFMVSNILLFAISKDCHKLTYPTIFYYDLRSLYVLTFYLRNSVWTLWNIQVCKYDFSTHKLPNALLWPLKCKLSVYTVEICCAGLERI